MSELKMIPVTAIDDPAFNSRIRSDPAKIKALAETIDSEGLRQPIEVEGPFEMSTGDIGKETIGEPRYRLVFGSRRLAAHKLLNRDEIQAIVRDPMEPVNQVLANLMENAAREDLTTYELARACDALRSNKLKLDEVAKRIGKTKAYVSNLVIMYNSLDPSIRFHWEKSVALWDSEKGIPGTSDGITWYPIPLNKLRTLATIKDREAQLKAFKPILEEEAGRYRDANGESTPKKNKRNGKSSSTSITVINAHLLALIDLVKSKDAPKLFGASQAKFLRQTVDWLIGQRKTHPEGFPVPEQAKGE